MGISEIAMQGYAVLLVRYSGIVRREKEELSGNDTISDKAYGYRYSQRHYNAGRNSMNSIFIKAYLNDTEASQINPCPSSL